MSSGSSPLSRRSVVSAAVSTLALGTLAQNPPPRRRIKIGLVGCGGRGTLIARLIQQNGNYDLHAVADYFQPVAAACGEAHGVDPQRCFSGLSGYKRLIESGVEAIALETPPCFFPEHAAAAVDAGLHVYMAKPVAVDVPGVMTIKAAAQKATQSKRCFFVDYQIPTDPHNIQAAARLRDGLAGTVQTIRSHYWGTPFPDPPLTDNLESRLRQLTWCNDVAVGGGYHVNADIHSIHAVLWATGRSPTSALGISSRTRDNAHGDSHDVFSVAFRFDDGQVWSHMGRHVKGARSPEESFSRCEIYTTDAYIRIGYDERAFVRGGSKPYAGGKVESLYNTGIIRNLATFHQHVTQANVANDTVPLALESCLVTILAREACLARKELSMQYLIAQNKRLEVDLKGLKS